MFSPGCPPSVGGRRAEVEGQHVHLVLEPAEADVEDRRRGHRVVEARAPGFGSSPSSRRRGSRAPRRRPGRRRSARRGRTSRSCSGRRRSAGAEPAVAAHVEGVAVELLRALGDVVVARAVDASRSRSGSGIRLRIASAWGESRLAGMMLPGNWAAGRIPGERVEDVDAVLARGRRCGRARWGRSAAASRRPCCASPGSRRRRTSLFFRIGPPSEPPNWSRFVSGSTRPVSGFTTSGCEKGLRAWNLSL